MLDSHATLREVQFRDILRARALEEALRVRRVTGIGRSRLRIGGSAASMCLMSMSLFA